MQSFVQLPQAVLLLGVSQALSAAGAAGVLQLAEPSAQDDRHRPPAHILASTLVPPHARPQAPQSRELVSRLVSQPSSGEAAGGEEQSAKVPVQLGVHAPPWHAVEDAWVSEQVRPQAPQLAASSSVSDSHPSSEAGADGRVQLPNPGSQDEVHTPPAQAKALVCVAAHVRPQSPQLAASPRRSVSQPSSLPVAGRLQLPKPGLQVESQVPSVQLRVRMFALAHARPHAPQLSGSDEVRASQPSSAVFSGGVAQSA